MTYIAAAFVFVGVAALMYFEQDAVRRKDIFLSILPVATGVITYWFADKSHSKSKAEK